MCLCVCVYVTPAVVYPQYVCRPMTFSCPNGCSGPFLCWCMGFSVAGVLNVSKESQNCDCSKEYGLMLIFQNSFSFKISKNQGYSEAQVFSFFFFFFFLMI